MTVADLIALRLYNQQLIQPQIKDPAALVKWLGAIQAQDYAAAKWAVGLRLPGIVDADVDRMFNSGEILRTHLMRPTWHFVASEDILWLIGLTAPRVKAQCSYMNRKMELDEKTLKRCNKLITVALKDNNYLTRTQLGALLLQAGIAVNDLRLTCIMMMAELEAIVCSGPQQGKQFTYALLSERAPVSTKMQKHEAAAELATRYFTSHGPATLQDFVWWSGVTLSDAKAGLETIENELQKEVLEGKNYWYKTAGSYSKTKNNQAVLLPNYDEYIVAYKDRSAIFDPAQERNKNIRGSMLFNHTIVQAGKVVGTWKRTLTKDKVIIEPIIFIKPTNTLQKAIVRAAGTYASFLGLHAEISW